MIPPTKIHRKAGFTILEVLVATALFTTLVLIIVAPLTGLFGLTQQSSQQADATSIAQNGLEQIKGQWLLQARYDQACIVSTSSATSSVVIQNEDAQGNSQGSPVVLGVSSSCGTGTAVAGPALRKVTVTAITGKGSSTLSVEIARP